MTLVEFVRGELQPHEKLIVISTWSVMRMMPDGSAMLYKNTLGTLQSVALSRHDLETIKLLALPVPIFTPEPENNRDESSMRNSGYKRSILDILQEEKTAETKRLAVWRDDRDEYHKRTDFPTHVDTFRGNINGKGFMGRAYRTHDAPWDAGRWAGNFEYCQTYEEAVETGKRDLQAMADRQNKEHAASEELYAKLNAIAEVQK